MHPLQLTAGPPAEVAHLEVVPRESVAEPAPDDLRDLRLETERSAGRALIAAITELETRLNRERRTSHALLETTRELSAALDDERARVLSQRESNAQLWVELRELGQALTLAEQPWWRRLRRS